MTVLLLMIGYYMTYMSDYRLYHVHKSLAIVMVCLFIPRAALRAMAPWPSAVQGAKRHMLSLFHWSLILLTAVLLISGASYSGFGGYGIALFSLPLISKNLDELGSVEAINATLSEVGLQVHVIAALLLAVLIGAHIFAALIHHFKYKDDTLKRMIRGPKELRE